MEIGTQHVAKLEPFLLMSKAAKGAAAAKLIQDATSAPGVFVFGELLDLPNIQEVRTEEHGAMYHLNVLLRCSWLRMKHTRGSTRCFSCSHTRRMQTTSVSSLPLVHHGHRLYAYRAQGFSPASERRTDHQVEAAHTCFIGARQPRMSYRLSIPLRNTHEPCRSFPTTNFSEFLICPLSVNWRT